MSGQRFSSHSNAKRERARLSKVGEETRAHKPDGLRDQTKKSEGQQFVRFVESAVDHAEIADAHAGGYAEPGEQLNLEVLGVIK